MGWKGLKGLDGMKRIKGIGWDEYVWMEWWTELDQ